MSDKDKALEAFLSTARLKEAEYSEDLLLQIYNIEKTNQYRSKSDRGAVTREIENLVNKYLEDKGTKL